MAPTFGQENPQLTQAIKRVARISEMRKMAGTGVPNVFLVDGTMDGPEGSIAYRDLDGLYKALAGAIAARVVPMTPGELRFLRKRLNMTQEAVGRLGGKTGQVAAMWEKGTRPVPVAEGNMLRLVWLARHAKRGVVRAVRAMEEGDGHILPCDYVLRFVEGKGWREDIELAHAFARERAEKHTAHAIAQAMSAPTVERYATSAAPALLVTFEKEMFT